MAVYEMWSCDRHGEPPEESGHVLIEDEARDKGYVELERQEPYRFVPTDRTHTVRGHVCPECLEDPETHAWLEREKWKASWPEGRDAIEQAKAKLAA